MRFLHLFLIAVAIALAANSGATMAQNYLWLPTAEDPPGDWNDMANWSDAGGDFVPEGQVNETAQISSGGTAFVQDVIDNSGFSGDGTLGPGEITVTNGSVLEIRSGALMSTDIRGGSVTGAVLVNSGASLRFLGSGELSAELLTMGGGWDFRLPRNFRLILWNRAGHDCGSRPTGRRAANRLRWGRQLYARQRRATRRRGFCRW